MESKWYLFPGQTHTNTKIDDRANALHCNQTEWNRIHRHLDRKKIIQETIDKELEKKQTLKEMSAEMTAQWENSIENIRKRKSELRALRTVKKEQEKIDRYYQLRDEQKAERKKFVEKMRKQAYMKMNYPRELNGALVFSEVLYERGKQQEFSKMLKQHEEQVDEEIAIKIKREADEEKLENTEKERKYRETQKAHSDTLKRQILENQQNLELEKTERIRKEATDQMKAEKEMALISQIEHEEKLRKRQEWHDTIEKCLADKREKERIENEEDKQRDEIIKIQAGVKTRIDCLRKRKEKELQEAICARTKEAADKLAAGQQAKDEDEERVRQAAIQEKEALALAQIEAKKKKNEEIRLDRMESREKYLERLENEKHIQDEMKRWEMLNRFKTDQALKEYAKIKSKERWNKILEHRHDLMDQIAENEKRQKVKESIENKIVKEKIEQFAADDQKFLEYADEVLNLAKSRNRNPYPIERVIMNYKKVNNLLPKENKKNCRCCLNKK